MFRRLLQFSPAVEEPPRPGKPAEIGAEAGKTVERRGETHLKEAEPQTPTETLSLTVPVTTSGSLGKFVPFDDIYRGASSKAPRVSYGILKVIDMVNSQHLAGMSSEAKRCSLMMALDAAGANVEDVLQDAMVRQRPLNDYDDAQQQRLKEFEEAKMRENSSLQAELDRFTTECLRRIQSNLDEVSQQEDNLAAWQKRKLAESQKIAEAAMICAPQSPNANPNLTSVVSRMGSEASGSRSGSETVVTRLGSDSVGSRMGNESGVVKR
jgi:hypothetical protein